MDREEVLALFDRQMRRDARPDGPGARVERDGDVVRQVGADHDWNGVLWSDLDEATADAAIAAQVRYFGTLGRGFEWKAYAHDRPGDLGRRLRSAGFTAEPEEAVMVARIQDLPTDVALPEGVRLHPVTDPAGVDLVVDVHEQAFGTSGAGLRQRLLTQLARRAGTVSAVVAMAGDLPVCSARMELNPATEFAGLWGGGTVAAWRGRGIYRAVVAHRARIAAGLGYRYLQVDASDQSRPILRRLGFAVLSTTTPYVHQPRHNDRAA
ncbi:GNAT family N-acetyltransferase [Streptomyces hainanensis]|uniref:GNAT family N-acetyltransferase n=1 Tax=Streptomyces hainanensis TaxID=402648 RepID=A0A4R4TNP8_9ACTN|nr:GNAT family N-acetyltransferase [Streptomyces hainanensis]TDC79707.1 GNAT family N-acetyltransferase [Streptomyces hainanensis]